MATRPGRRAGEPPDMRGCSAVPRAVPGLGDAPWRRPAAVSHCRCCGAPLTEPFADLGMAPLPTAYVPPENAAAIEPHYPLRALVCSDCRLVQLAAVENAPAMLPEEPGCSRIPATSPGAAEVFGCRMMERLHLGSQTPVLLLASDDDRLLRCFLGAGIPVLGRDGLVPAVQAAIARGTAPEAAEFGAARARWLRATRPAPALILAGDILAHAVDLHDVIAGVRILLAPGGVAVFEVQHLLPLMRNNAFDSIHHGRQAYLSVLVAELILGQHGLTVFDAEELPGDAGSLRLFVRHVEDTSKPVTAEIERIRAEEREAGLEGRDAYARFAARVVEAKCALLDFLTGAYRGGRRVVAYGALARGNTLLNYCSVGPELLPFTVDRDPEKQGMLLPGTRIPVRAPTALVEEKPDFVLILPWHQRDAVMEQLAAVRRWGGRFVAPIPTLEVL